MIETYRISRGRNREARNGTFYKETDPEPYKLYQLWLCEKSSSHKSEVWVTRREADWRGNGAMSSGEIIAIARGGKAA